MSVERVVAYVGNGVLVDDVVVPRPRSIVPRPPDNAHRSSCLCAECWARKEDDWNARDAGWFKRPEVAGTPTLQVVSRRSPELKLPSESAGRAEKIGPRPRCRVCGCTDDDCSGCIERTGEPCMWFEPDLCSACVPMPEGPR